MIAKTIIGIWGRQRQGKSETVRTSAELLSRLPGANPANITFSTTDINVIITIGNVRIGITSQGDPDSGLPRRVRNLVENEKCDIIVCSTRSHGDTYDAVGAIGEENGYRVIRATNYRVNEGLNAELHGVLNQLSSEQIVELVKKIRDGLI